jgi:hypothetical protein
MHAGTVSSTARTRSPEAHSPARSERLLRFVDELLRKSIRLMRSGLETRCGIGVP